MDKLIMVVNDNWDVLNLYQTLLIEEGYRVSLRELGTDELEQTLEIQPDLIITDLGFGREILGWTFIQQIRNNQATSHIPIILCTGEMIKFRELNTQLRQFSIRFVAKPFNIDELLSQVASALAQ